MGRDAALGLRSESSLLGSPSWSRPRGRHWRRSVSSSSTLPPSLATEGSRPPRTRLPSWVLSRRTRKNSFISFIFSDCYFKAVKGNKNLKLAKKKKIKNGKKKKKKKKKKKS